MDLYIVRHWDGFDGGWLDVSEPVSKKEAKDIWDAFTFYGKRNTQYNDIDYYKIFPADTKMIFSEGRSQLD